VVFRGGGRNLSDFGLEVTLSSGNVDSLELNCVVSCLLEVVGELEDLHDISSESTLEGH
jgi:hypothetical protein